MGCNLLLQGIFPTQRSKSCLLHLPHWQASSFGTEPASRYAGYDVFILNTKMHLMLKKMGQIGPRISQYLKSFLSWHIIDHRKVDQHGYQRRHGRLQILDLWRFLCRMFSLTHGEDVLTHIPHCLEQ